MLPEIISKEPLGPLVRQGDDAWFNVVKWTYYALLNAEELGVTPKNVDDMKANSTNPEVIRLLGKEGDFGTGIGLTNDWVVQIVKAVGNYGEIFERNVGRSDAAQDRARQERAVEQRRPAIRTADPLSTQRKPRDERRASLPYDPIDKIAPSDSSRWEGKG